MKTLVIADDHKLVLQGLTAMLSSSKELDILSTFENGKDLMEYLETTTPDILLLDINMPDINGLDVCKLVSKQYPSVKIIALTNYSETSFVKNMIRNGAKGYLLKNCTQQEIITAINEVTEGRTYLPEDIQKQLLNENFGVQASNSFIPKLTRREVEVLSAIADQQTNKEIAESLFISVKTVETHRNNLLQKFYVKNTAGLIKEAYIKGVLT